jgi:hypothetical protein
MAGRLRVCLFVAVCAFGTERLNAQGVAPLVGNPAAPTAVSNGLGTPWIQSTYGNPVGYPAANSGYYAPDCPTADDGMVIQHVSHDYGYEEGFEETPLDRAIHRALRSAWVRFDYLHWSIEEPGDVLVGASTTTIGDDFLTKYYPTNGSRTNPDVYFRDVDLTSVGLNDVPGVQTTIGLPTTIGVFEWSGFIMQQASDEVIARDLPGVGSAIADEFFFFLGDSAPLAVGLTTTINGQEVDAGTAATRQFNNFFRARVATDVFGTEFNFYKDSYDPGEGFHFRPMLGFRYFGVQEKMRIDGNNIDDSFVVVSEGKVSTDTFNNLYGPQAGFRAELKHRWFTIGCEPKLTVGANSFVSTMKTSDLYGDGEREFRDETTKAMVIGDLDVYARIPLHEYCAVFVSYNLAVASDVARPFDNARYDILVDDSDNVTNNFHMDDKTKSMRFEGYTLGVELIIP